MTPMARIANYGANTVLTRHRHSASRLCVVLSGEFEEDENSQVRINRAGHLLYRPAEMPHAERFGKGGAVCTLISPSRSWMEAAREHRFDLSAPAAVASLEIVRLGAAFRRECARWDEFSTLSCEAAAWECLSLLGREGVRNDRSMSEPVRRAAEYMRENLAEPVDLARIARVAGVHATTLSRQFRRTFGESIGSHFRRLRVERAVTLLTKSQTPIAEIALVCGFSSQAHLTTLLRNALGVTPARLRAMHRI